MNSTTTRHLLCRAAAALFLSTLLHGQTPEPKPAAGAPPHRLPLQPKQAVADVFAPLPTGAVTIAGWLGQRLDVCMERRVMAQNVDRLVESYRKRDNDKWESEYWGKWYTSAVFGYGYQPTAAHRTKIDAAAQALIQTQTPDGQLTGFDASQQLGVNWDLWGRKYALLGLIAHYDATGDARSLEAVRKAADFIADHVDRGMVIGAQCLPIFKGVQSTSILAEFAMLYGRTGDPRYLRVAETIVKQWDQPNPIAPQGLRLLSDALAGKPPFEIGSRKAYEVAANYEGLLELYRVTGDKKYFEGASQYVRRLLEQERMAHGSLSNNEEWFYGVKNQTGVLEQPVETCVTAQWMLICWQMLRLTGEPKWADELELSLYNALLGTMTPDGNWWSYFGHINGERIPCQFHHKRTRMACCVTSGPRGLLLTSHWSVMKADDGLVVNLYASGSTQVQLRSDLAVTLVQDTAYPESEAVKITVRPSQPAKFKLRLRIPSWSAATTLTVKGEPVPCEPGKYAEIERTWTDGDRIDLALDLRTRAIPAPSGAPELVLKRGPVLLALDSRLAKIENQAIYIDVDKDGYVAVRRLEKAPADVWMAFEVPVYTMRGPVKGHRPAPPQVFCDYPSAGNQWTATNTFRTWLPQPLYLPNAFTHDVWKLAYEKERPPLPRFEDVGP